jgi:hypothetical protein
MLVRHNHSTDRRAVILMVVLAMLTLFTVVGITFVFLADSYATSARLAKEAENIIRPEIDPELAFSYALGQLNYDVPDDANGILSSFRGHSFSRTAFGWNSTANALNDKAYAGVGRLRYTSVSPTVNDFNLVNYKYFQADGFLRDPEHIGSRASLAAAYSSQYVCGAVPYTYVDQNNMFLAHLDNNPNSPTFNQVVIPSFHRPWVFNIDPATGNQVANAFNDPNHTNWTSAMGKYLTLRPRPADNTAQFPLPEDAGGDVKNWDGGPGGNDSIWIDINAPVIVAPNGVRYKMLVAPLILALDGRVNLSAHGNILGSGNVHAGNQGVGPYEVNLSKVLVKDAGNVEWKNLFLGNTPSTDPNNPVASRIPGLYGMSGRPQKSAGSAAPGNGTGSRGWSLVDFNGVKDPVQLFGVNVPANNFLSSSVWALPGSFNPFPNFPQDSYNDGFPRELTLTGAAPGAGNPIIHPVQYNSLRPGPGNRNFSAYDMAAMLRSGGTNAEFLSSDLLRLCPTNFADARTRNMAAHQYFDLDRPVPIPYVWDRTVAPYAMNTTVPYPYSIQQPDVTNPYPQANVAANRAATPATSEFDPATWRSILTALNKINLNRTLSPFPVPDPATGLIPAAQIPSGASPSYTDALGDRVAMANDIFNVLQQATGARNPATDAKLISTNYPAPQWNALRYLAQLSVNIVDFIDQDDIITPFQWNDPTDPTPAWVYGVEMPRLVINEVYVQMNNDPNDAGVTAKTKAMSPYNVNMWAELVNPIDSRSDPVYNTVIAPSTFPGKDPEARLVTGGAAPYPVYQLIIAQSGISAILQDPANVTGDPDFNLAAAPAPAYTDSNGNPTRVIKRVMGATDFGAGAIVPPADGNYGDGTLANAKGFFVVGSNGMYFPGDDPTILKTQPSANMQFTVPLEAANNNPPAVPNPTFLLRRLHCPGLTPNPPLNANGTTGTLNGAIPSNPYITTDYLENTKPGAANANDGRQYVVGGANGNMQGMASRQSMGRKQPWAAAAPQVVVQAPNPALVGAPQHTFLRQNGTAPTAAAFNLPDATFGGTTGANKPADWLVHLDRQLISKSELLYVAGCKPHELTQLFVQGGKSHQQIAPWTDPTTRLYRFLEFGSIKPRASGVPLGGRVPGRINVNILNDIEVFRAVCDQELGNQYTAADVDNLFNKIIAARTPGANGIPGPNDQPYWGLGFGNAATGADALSAGPRVVTNQWPYASGFNFATTPTNPYQNTELLNKLTGNLTTRSNVFAVWMTVGFFQVNAAGQLGAEVGKSENRNVRHRMFAIVDRTNMQIFSTTATAAITGVPAGQSNTFKLAQMSGTVAQSGFSWQVQAGSVLVFDPNTDTEEVVVVQGGDSTNGFTATFYQNHNANCPVISRGNPGPATQQPYNPRADSAVVPYFSIIN